MGDENLKNKVCIITCVLVHETSEMANKRVEAVIKLYLKPENIPLCEKIEKITVLGETA